MSLLLLPSHVAQWHSVLLDYFSSGLASWVLCLCSQTSVSRLFSLLSFQLSLLLHWQRGPELYLQDLGKPWIQKMSPWPFFCYLFSAWELLTLHLPLKGQLIHARLLTYYALNTDECESASDFTDSSRIPCYILIT